MISPDRLVPGALPDPVLKTLNDFEAAFGVAVRLFLGPSEPGAASEILYASERAVGKLDTEVMCRRVTPRGERVVDLEVRGPSTMPVQGVADLLAATLTRTYEAVREMRFFTAELSERYEEIHLLYSISETLGTILHMEDAARVILREVCDVMGAKEGSLWLHDHYDGSLHLTAAAGGDENHAPLRQDDPDPVTSMVFHEQRAIIASRAPTREERARGVMGDSLLSVPIRYTPPSVESRTLGVMNLVGRREEERYSAADQKLLSAIASQVGSALENKRLHEESVSQERMGREMELAQDLQQKLLPDAGRFEAAEAAARVSPAEQVGGDFYQLFRLPEGRVGCMLGDVSLHGFPSALIMTLTLSAAGIYAREHASPATVLRQLDNALREELETTEMFLTVFYGVIDPAQGTLVYSNAGHPHAFVVSGDGSLKRLMATDPPVGFAGPDSYSEISVEWRSAQDLLLLFTDGLSDTLASVTRGDGEQRVLDTVVSHRVGPVRDIVERLFALEADASPPHLGDDRTALVVRTR